MQNYPESQAFVEITRGAERPQEPRSPASWEGSCISHAVALSGQRTRVLAGGGQGWPGRGSGLLGPSQVRLPFDVVGELPNALD